jgi:hypothetical protein
MEGKKSHEVVLDIFYGTKEAKGINELMHALDVFEAGKRLALFERLTVSGNPDVNKLPDNIKKSYEKAGGYVLFVAVRTIDGKKPKKLSAWFQDGIQSISDGNKWGLFKDLLEQLGYEVGTDEHMRVTTIK